jgi:hypothetical protein
MINVTVKIFLKSPYNPSMSYIFSIANRKNYKILNGNYNANYVILGLTWKQFKLLFKKNPILGKDYKSENKFILNIKVIKIDAI